MALIDDANSKGYIGGVLVKMSIYVLGAYPQVNDERIFIIVALCRRSKK